MFSIETVKVEVDHAERVVNEMLATYGDGEAQAKQMNAWLAEGWKRREDGSWYFPHPVPKLCWKGDPDPKKFPALQTLTPAQREQLDDSLNSLFDIVGQQDGIDAYEFANVLSSGLQYKTRPNLKKASEKGRKEKTNQIALAQRIAKFFQANATNPAAIAEFTTAADPMVVLTKYAC